MGKLLENARSLVPGKDAGKQICEGDMDVHPGVRRHPDVQQQAKRRAFDETLRLERSHNAQQQLASDRVGQRVVRVRDDHVHVACAGQR